MLLSRRTVLVFAVGLLFGYTLTYIVISSLYSQSNSRRNTVHYFVPSAPHSHGEMDRYIPALTNIQQWRDFDESSHIGMYLSPSQGGKQDHLLISGCGVPAP